MASSTTVVQAAVQRHLQRSKNQKLLGLNPKSGITARLQVRILSRQLRVENITCVSVC